MSVETILFHFFNENEIIKEIVKFLISLKLDNLNDSYYIKYKWCPNGVPEAKKRKKKWLYPKFMV